MTKEEAIKKLKQIVKDYKGKDNASQEIVLAIETVLSMLEEKDKVIDLMAGTISLIDTDIKVIKNQIKEEYCDFLKSDADCCWKTDVKCQDCIKQYFENKVRQESDKGATEK